jgi:stage IV sporulation protein FB
VFLVEPSTSPYDVHFSLFGYPVRIHPYFWLTTLFLGPLELRAAFNVIWVLVVLICILLHELGHAVVMKLYGYYPSIVLYSFGGLAIPHRGSYTARRPGPWGDMLIAFAGPASGFILAALVVFGFKYLGGYPVGIFEESWRDVVPTVLIVDHNYLHYFVNEVLYICVMWGLVNLLPLYPLDGGQIAQQVFYLNNPQDAMRPTLILAVIVGGLLTAYFVMQAIDQHSGMHFQGWYLPIFFGWLTYSNYTMLQSTQIRGGW